MMKEKKSDGATSRLQTSGLKSSTISNLFVVNLIPGNLSEAEKRNGVSFLWDGRTTTGWRGAYKENFLKKAGK
jgi:hypothetical protein